MAEAVPDNIIMQCTILYFHFLFGEALILLGIVAMIARIPVGCIERTLKPWHATMGLAWVYGMIIQIATSLYCRNDGFRTFIFGFLTICVVNMIVGHMAIRAFQRDMARQKGSAPLKDDGGARELEEISPAGEIATEAVPVAPPRYWLKWVHGITMPISFSMLLGAGIMFTIRSKSLGNCKPIYAYNDAMNEENLPALIHSRVNDDGVTEQIWGGYSCTLTSGTAGMTDAEYTCVAAVPEVD